MRRLFQLLMPALAALVVGLFVFFFTGFDAFEVRGGPFVLGLYMLCTAAALAVVVALCLDTTYRPTTAAGAKKRGRMLDIARQPNRLARTYVQMYTIPFLPIALLTFGIGILVSEMLFGLAAPVYVQEIIMAAWLVLMSLGIAAWGSRPAAFGCAAGIALAALATYTVDLDSPPEQAIWGLGLVILTILILIVGALFRRRSARHVEPA
jgi:hypothetical protein